MHIPRQGVMAATVTPLDEDEAIDVASLERLVEWIIAGGVQGIFVGGTIGEGAALRDTERARLIRETVRLVRGRIPVLANVSDTGTVRILEHIGLAATGGVDAVVTTARISFPARDPGDVLRMMEVVAKASPVPVWFYENPAMTPVKSTFEDIQRILALPNIGGIKFSAPDRELYARCALAFTERLPVYNGNVPDLAFAASLGTGALVGIGGMLPGLCVRIWETARKGHVAEAEQMQADVNAVYGIYLGKNWPLWPSAQKHVLKRRGIFRTSISTAPFKRLTPDDERRIDAVLDQIGDRIFAAASAPVH